MSNFFVKSWSFDFSEKEKKKFVQKMISRMQKGSVFACHIPELKCLDVDYKVSVTHLSFEISWSSVVKSVKREKATSSFSLKARSEKRSARFFEVKRNF